MKKDQQIDYIEAFTKADRPNLSTRSKVRAIENIRVGEFKSKPARTRDTRKADPADRKTCIPRSAKLNVTDNKTAEIAKELRRLKIDDSPHAIAVLLRVFLELSVDHYLDSKKIPLQYLDIKSGHKRDKTLKVKTQEAVGHLVAHGGVAKKDLFGVERAINDVKSPLYIELLHSYLHNRFVTPKPRELLAAWNDAQRFMECIWA